MFKLPPLPYDKHSFPHQISAENFDYHHGKHHLTYINNLNTLIAGTQWQQKSLEEIVTKCQDPKILNNAAQHWNHSFFWHCISPFKSEPSSELLQLIQHKWTTLDLFLKDFAAQAVANFGSGWTWLVRKDKELSILNTANAGNPLTQGYQPLLTLDVWQHAYYIDYRNARPKYVETFCSLIDWKFVEANFKAETVQVKL